MSMALRTLLIWLVALNAYSAEPVLSKDAPPDKPMSAATEDEVDRMHKAMEPYVLEAKRTYAAAKEKFLNGLPEGEHFFVTTRLRDAAGRIEQVFIAVSSIQNGTVQGMIYSQIQLVAGYSMRQPYSFPEADVIDWLITKPDGSEEGNFVGKFLDTYTGH